MDNDLFEALEKERDDETDKMVMGSDGMADGLKIRKLERNILGKFDVQHVAQEMNPFSHNCFDIEKNIIVGFNFSELKKETPGCDIFRVRINSLFLCPVLMLI